MENDTAVSKLLKVIKDATLNENWDAVNFLDDELIYARNLSVMGKHEESEKVANNAVLMYYGGFIPSN